MNTARRILIDFCGLLMLMGARESVHFLFGNSDVPDEMLVFLLERPLCQWEGLTFYADEIIIMNKVNPYFVRLSAEFYFVFRVSRNRMYESCITGSDKKISQSQ